MSEHDEHEVTPHGRVAGGRPTWHVLRSPRALTGPASMLVGLAVLLAPGASAPVALALLGVVIGRLIRRSPRDDRWTRAVHVAAAVMAAMVGVTLLAWPEPSRGVLGTLVGGYLAIDGLLRMVRARGVADPAQRRWTAVGGALTALFGAVVVVEPVAVAAFAVLAVGLGWLVTGAALTALTLRRGRPVSVRVLDRLAARWLRGRAGTVTDRSAIRRRLFFEGADVADRVGRFFALMGFAATIAVLGIVVDSTAVVVGAMLVAPLMTPLMGAAAAVVAGWPGRMRRATGVAFAGSALAMAVAFIVTGWLPVAIDVVGNSQIASRTTPTLIDLLIALAAGGAGAFAITRPDVSDALPGVAVAIALVPPLCVVGVTARAGAPDLAVGALLLFAANAVGILVAGGVVFVVTGFAPVAAITRQRTWIRDAAAGVAIVGLAVFMALGVTSRDTLDAGIAARTTRTVVATLADGSYAAVDVTVVDDHVDVTVVGDDTPPDADLLAADLAVLLDRDIAVTLRWTPRTMETARGRRSR